MGHMGKEIGTMYLREGLDGERYLTVWIHADRPRWLKWTSGTLGERRRLATVLRLLKECLVTVLNESKP